MAYLKPQTPLKDLNSGDYFYPLTTLDQIVIGNSRLSAFITETNGRINLLHVNDIDVDGSDTAYISVNVLASNWSSTTINTLGDGNNYYYYVINLTGIYTEIPRIELVASGNNDIPTVAEAKAFSRISKPKGWAVCDTTNNTITLYAQVKPDADFIIKIQGVTI